MKKSYFFFVLLFFCLPAIHAQSQIDHVKRTYIDPNGKIFINKALPVFLWLTTSPNEKSDAILLKSEGQPKYTNPMYFDVEGKNNIKHEYAVDQNTKQTVTPPLIVDFDVYVDGSAPSTTLTFSPAPKYISGGTTFYGRGLILNLKSNDEISGVENIFYSVDETPYQKYSSALPMDVEKTYTFKYYGADNVGNAENSSGNSFTVDLTPPKTSHGLTGPVLGNIVSPKTNLSLSFSDNLSGIASTRYDIDNRSSKVYSTPVSLAELSDGEHSLTYFSADNVKNEELPISYKFYMDKTAPIVKYEIVGDQFAGTKKYISSRTQLSLSATDNKAGVDKIFYSVDSGSQGTYESEFPVPSSDGDHSISYWGIDKVTNLAGKETLIVSMDNSNPKTSITYGSPQFLTRDTLFVNKNTPVILTSVDEGAGILKTEYSINSGTINKYSSSFKIADEGSKAIGYYSTDKVNNQEIAKTSRCFVDNTPPVIYFTFSIGAIDVKDGLNVYPYYSKLYLAATDEQVGTDNITFSVNGSPMKEYASPFALDSSEKKDPAKKNQKQTIRVISKDKLGNQSEQSVEYYLSY
jgi:hypothetical protein